tara:strand:+ start:904 stop:1236 length:333 start_codon:yes stop_codon:yes gene_type:complete
MPDMYFAKVYIPNRMVGEFAGALKENGFAMEQDTGFYVGGQCIETKLDDDPGPTEDRQNMYRLITLWSLQCTPVQRPVLERLWAKYTAEDPDQASIPKPVFLKTEVREIR